MKRLAVMLALLSCGGSVGTTVTYHLHFEGSAGVSTSVTFPLPTDAAHDDVVAQLTANDGGTLTPVTVRADTADGGDIAMQLSGFGVIDAEVSLKNVPFDEGSGAPDASLSWQVGDAGVDTHYLDVNTSDPMLTTVTFEYTASRSSGKRSWTYSGAPGIGKSAEPMTFSEEH